jgi:hypothetical protein
MTPIDLAGLTRELNSVKQKAADAQAAFMHLGGAAAGLKLSDVTKALQDIQKEADRLAKDDLKAAEQRLKEFRTALRQAFDGTFLKAGTAAFQAGINAIQSTLVGFVAKANPAAAIRFNLALDDLQATIGRAMLPALDQFTRLLRGIGSAFNGLDGNGQKLIAGIAAGTVGLIAFGAAALAVQTIMSGGLLPIFSAVAGAFGGFALVTADIGPALKEIGSIFSGVFNKLGAAVAGFVGSGAMTAIAVSLAEVAGVIADVAGGFLTGLIPAMNVFAQLVQVFTPIMTSLAGAAGAMLNAVVDMWANGIVSGVEMAAPYLLAFGELVLQVAKLSYEGWKTLFSYIGVNLPEFGQTNTPKGTTPDNTGAAARRTSTGGVSDVLTRARESSYGAGIAKPDDPAKKSATHLANIEEEAKKIVDGVNAFLSEFPAKVAAALGVELDALITKITNEAGGALADPAGAAANVIARLPSPGELADAAWNKAVSLFGN